jgi:hypothetical protein
MNELMSEKIEIGVGYDQSKDTEEGARRATKMALRRVGEEVLLNIVFASGKKYDHELLVKTVKEESGGHVFGCSTAGEIISEPKPSFSNGGVAVMSISTPYLRIGIGVGRDVRKNPVKAGSDAANMVFDGLKFGPVQSILSMAEDGGRGLPRNTLVVCHDGLAGKEEATISGIVDVTRSSAIKIVGASAGDDLMYKKTFVYADKAYTDAVACLGLAGGIKMGVGMRNAFRPMEEKYAFVTKSDGRLVHEINGRPAAEVYAEFVEKDVDELDDSIFMSHPVGIVDTGGEYWNVRSPQRVMDGKLIFYSNVPKGSGLTLLETDRNAMIDSIKDATEDAIRAARVDEVAGVAIFNCILRHQLTKVYGTQKEEIEAVRSIVGDRPMIGFSTYGETGMSPTGTVGHHNQTVTTIVFGV